MRAEQNREGRGKDISVAGEGGQREQGKNGREGGLWLGKLRNFTLCLSDIDNDPGTCNCFFLAF